MDTSVTSGAICPDWIYLYKRTLSESRIRSGDPEYQAEEEKGNQLVKETFPLLKECPGINFIGSIEAREIPHGGADVIVCEAFAGNIVLKLYEGVAATCYFQSKRRTDVISPV